MLFAAGSFPVLFAAGSFRVLFAAGSFPVLFAAGSFRVLQNNSRTASDYFRTSSPNLESSPPETHLELSEPDWVPGVSKSIANGLLWDLLSKTRNLTCRNPHDS